MFKLVFDGDFSFLWCAIFASIVILIFIFWDVQYFVRTFIVIVGAKLFEAKKKPEDITTIYGICTTSDLDIMFMHMNNARYVRELDFARFHFYERTGIYNAIKTAKGNVVQSACIIKYRRSIPLFTVYKVTTKLIHWDDKSIYIEQQFISLKDGFVRAAALSKQGVINVNVPELMAKLVGKDITYRPESPPDLQHFISCMDASSSRLRRKD